MILLIIFIIIIKMNPILPIDLVPGELYYIQSPKLWGHGRQKGYFIELDGSIAFFNNIEDLMPHSGCLTGENDFNTNTVFFYMAPRD